MNFMMSNVDAVMSPMSIIHQNNDTKIKNTKYKTREERIGNVSTTKMSLQDDIISYTEEKIQSVKIQFPNKKTFWIWMS
jgi:hypothetical protein